jgi:hypothetical protein
MRETAPDPAHRLEGSTMSDTTHRPANPDAPDATEYAAADRGEYNRADDEYGSENGYERGHQGEDEPGPARGSYDDPRATADADRAATESAGPDPYDQDADPSGDPHYDAGDADESVRRDARENASDGTAAGREDSADRDGRAETPSRRPSVVSSYTAPEVPARDTADGTTTGGLGGSGAHGDSATGTTAASGTPGAAGPGTHATTAGLVPGSSAAVAEGPTGGPDAVGPHGEGDPADRVLEDGGDLRTRLQEALGGFVDDPPRAVRDADGVLEEAVERLTDALRDRRNALMAAWDSDRAQGGDTAGGSGDRTEDLRLALRAYRDLAERLLAL